MNPKHLAIVIIVVVAIGLTIFYGNDNTATTRKATPLVVTTDKAENAPSTNLGTSSILLNDMASAQSHMSPVARSPTQTSKREEVLALARSNSPADKFAAYKLVAKCFFSKEKYIVSPGAGENGTDLYTLNANAFNEQALCGDLSSAEILQRIQWLETAAAAGVTGAAQAFIVIGPNGNGNSSTRNLEWEGRVSRYIEIGAKSGDPYSLLVMSDRFDTSSPDSRDPILALAYYELAMDASSKIKGKPRQENDPVVQRLQSMLSKEQLKLIPDVKDKLMKQEH